jgi:hypothetical protein
MEEGQTMLTGGKASLFFHYFHAFIGGVVACHALQDKNITLSGFVHMCDCIKP